MVLGRNQAFGLAPLDRRNGETVGAVKENEKKGGAHILPRVFFGVTGNGWS